jgi:hypothetical protein
MTEAERIDIRLCIAFYEYHDWDWSDVVEFLARKANGSLPHQEDRARRRGYRRTGKGSK